MMQSAGPNRRKRRLAMHGRVAHSGLIVAALVTLRTPAALGAQNVRDSAGIRITTNRAIAAAPAAFRLSESPVLDFGGLHSDERYELSALAIGDLYRLPRGEVAVLDRYQIKFFHVDGRFLRSFGRKGGGPGEFQSAIRELCVAPSGVLLAMESTNPRFALFTGYRDFRGTMTFSGASVYRGCLGDGSFIARLARDGELGIEVRAARHVIVDQMGKVRGELGTFPVTDYNSLVPYEVNVVGHNGQVYVGDGRTFEYRVYSRAGRLIRIVRAPDSPAAFTRDDEEAVVKTYLPPGAPSAVLADLRKNLAAVPRPTRWPAFTRLLVDPLGRVWLGDPRKEKGEVVSWTVFDSTGVLMGRVRPGDAAIARRSEQFNIVRWAETEVIVSFVDSEGAAHVAALPFAPTRQGQARP